MKHVHSLLLNTLVAVLLAAPLPALSAECQIAFSQPVVSFGQLKQNEIAASQKNWNRMPAKEVTASVFCPQPQVMALFLQSASGMNGGILFGQDGRLVVLADNLFIDGHAYDIAKTTDRLDFSTADKASRKAFIKNNEGIIARQNNAVVRGKQMSVTLKLIPVINDTQFHHIADTTLLESHLAWELLTLE